MYDVVTIGTATQDVYLISKVFKVMNDPHFTQKAGFFESEGICFALGGKMEVEKIFISTGGGATNAAVTFARQGFKTACVSKVGKDSISESIKEELKKEKVDPFLIEDKFRSSAYSTLLLTPSGERTILVYRGASEYLKWEDIPFKKLTTKWVYFAPGGIKVSLLNRIVSYFYSIGAKIALNPGKAQISAGIKKLKRILEKTNILILNREEASRFTGVPYDMERKILYALEENFSGIIVITDGKNGSILSDGKIRLRAGIFKERKLIDRTGAGDAFGAGFVAGIIQNPGDYSYAIRLASANATSNIEIIGAKTGILTKEDFLKNSRWGKLKIERI